MPCGGGKQVILGKKQWLLWPGVCLCLSTHAERDTQWIQSGLDANDWGAASGILSLRGEVVISLHINNY